MMRVVIDTNVVLSGLIKPASVPGQVLRAWRDGSIRLVLSEFLIEEIAVTLARPKIQALVPWPAAQIDRFVLELRAFCDVVEPAELNFKYPRDPDDIPVLATLIASGADLLVTGDRDLLILREEYPIETPAEFVRRL
jgi:putative PIN family toxin of toxin-antitoxin system